MLKQTQAAKRRTDAVVGGSAGVVMAMAYTYAFDEAYTAATDVIEMGMFPARNQLLAAEVIGDGVGIVTADVGIMTGVYGDTQDATRDTGTEIFAAADVNDAAVKAPTATCLALPKQNTNVGIGLSLSADVAAGAAKTVTVVLYYYA